MGPSATTCGSLEISGCSFRLDMAQQSPSLPYWQVLPYPLSISKGKEERLFTSNIILYWPKFILGMKSQSAVANDTSFKLFFPKNELRPLFPSASPTAQSSCEDKTGKGNEVCDADKKYDGKTEKLE